MMQLGDETFPVLDSDNHLYESDDALLRYLPDVYRESVRYIQVGRHIKIALKNRIIDFIPNPTFTVVAKPGAHMQYYRGDNPDGKSRRQMGGEPMKSIPAFRSPEPRLDMMDELGIDACIVYPTLCNLVEANLVDDPELTQVVIHSFNQWLHEEWTFNYKSRIFATPVLNLSTLDGAMRELEWVLERDPKMLLMRPAPVGTYRGPCSPFLEVFDPFWGAIEDSGVPVAFHASDSGYQRFSNEWEGNAEGEYLPFKPNAFQLLAMGQRPIMDTFFSALAHGMLSRFPRVSLLAVENGSTWVPRLLEDLHTIHPRMPQQFLEDPIEVFRRQIYINPFWEDPVDDLIDLIGVDRVVFGSDWPHPEGLERPLDFAQYCTDLGLQAPAVAKVMGRNMAELLDVPMP